MSGVVKGVGMLLGISKPKIPKAPAPQPIPTRNEAAAAAMEEDDVRRRRGTRVNNITGGAESSTAGGKALLGDAG